MATNPNFNPNIPLISMVIQELKVIHKFLNLKGRTINQQSIALTYDRVFSDYIKEHAVTLGRTTIAMDKKVYDMCKYPAVNWYKYLEDDTNDKD